MTNSPKGIRKQEKYCVEQFRADCIRIEKQQDAIKEQRKCLHAIEEQIGIDTEKAYKDLEEYYSSTDTSAHQMAQNLQTQLVESRTRTEKYFEEVRSNLNAEQEKLTATYVKRKEGFKKEIQELQFNFKED